MTSEATAVESAFDRQRIADFLHERGADSLPHPGGTLYAHVFRVAGLLAEWGAGQPLQAAGLCHACYGTDGFDESLLPTSERARLSALIGPEAEAIVYLYGSCDRAAVYPRLGDAGPVPFRDRFTGGVVTPSEPEIRAFAELSAANELDVVRHNQEIAAEHGPGLLRLFGRVRHRLSDAAWQAWTEVPGTGYADE